MGHRITIIQNSVCSEGLLDDAFMRTLEHSIIILTHICLKYQAYMEGCLSKDSKVFRHQWKC